MRFVLAVFLFADMISPGCGTRSRDRPPVRQKMPQHPEWVDQESRAVVDETGPRLIAVGTAAGIRNAAQRRQTANVRAQAGAEEVLLKLIARLTRRPSGTTVTSSGDDESAAHDPVLGQWRAHLVEQVQFVDHFVDYDGTEYALAELRVVEPEPGKYGLDKELRARVCEALPGAMRDLARDTTPAR